MGSGPHGSLSNSGQGNDLAPITHPSGAPEPSDVAVTETFTASQHLAGPADCVGAIDTTSVAGADTHTPYYPGTGIPRPSAQPRRFWNAGHGGETPASTWIVILLSGLSGFLIAGTFSVVSIALAERDPPGHRGPAFDGNGELIAGVACALFFGTIYFTGQFLYRRLGQKAELERVRELRKQHMPLLWLVAGVCVAGRPGMNAYDGTAMPRDWLLLTVGLLILAYSIRGIIIALRSRVPYNWLLSRR
jgi:hypothetical protein